MSSPANSSRSAKPGASASSHFLRAVLSSGGRVERAQRTHRQEYYERCDIPQTIKDHNTDLKRWQNTYNTVRPHQTLEYRTPLQKLQEFGILTNVPPPSVSHMS